MRRDPPLSEESRWGNGSLSRKRDYDSVGTVRPPNLRRETYTSTRRVIMFLQ